MISKLTSKVTSRKPLCLVALAILFAASAQAAADAEIRAVLEKQVFDWNRGDTEGFLIGYAPDAIFVSDKVTHGIEELRARYQSHYPTRASMGTLTFSDVEVHIIDPTHAYVIGRFHLKREADAGGDSTGMYTLLFKKTDRGWKIAVDHTS